MANTRVTTPVTDFDKSTILPGLKLPSGDNSNQPAGAAAAQGMIRNDTEETVDSSASAIAHYNGTAWQYFAATESPDAPPINVDYLVVAGGGAGGRLGGGGGAGGYRTSFGSGSINGGLTAVETSQNLLVGISYTVTIGAGASSVFNGNSTLANSGSDSIFDGITSITSTGGGGGRNHSDGNGGSGGSGGGAASAGNSFSGGSRETSPVQGFSGAANSASVPYPGGGGGGAGAAGSTPNGGTALSSSITGTATLMAGGGGGGSQTGYYGGSLVNPGGGGGAGNGSGSSTAGSNAVNNTGSGGGGGGYSNNYGLGGSGGSGLVILRYPIANNINIVTGTSPIAADLNATVAGSTTEKFTRFTATGAVTFTIS